MQQKENKNQTGDDARSGGFMSKLNKEFDFITPPGHLEQRVKDALEEAKIAAAGNFKQTAEKPRKKMWLNPRKLAALATALVIFVSAVLTFVFVNFDGRQEKPWQILQRPWQSLSGQSELDAFDNIDELKNYIMKLSRNAETYLDYNRENEDNTVVENFLTAFAKDAPVATDGFDIVQTDGDYIYTVSYDTLTIISTENCDITAAVKFNNFFPDSILLLKEKGLLVVLGGMYDYDTDYYKNGVYATDSEAAFYSQNYWYSNTAVIRIYKINTLIEGSDTVLRELTFKNAYINLARINGNNLQLSLCSYNALNGDNVWIPEYYDSFMGTAQKLSPQNIYAAPDNGLFFNYTLFAGLDISGLKDAAVTACLGSYGTVYAGDDGFYNIFPVFSAVARVGKDGNEYYGCQHSGTGIVRFFANGIDLKYSGYNIAQGVLTNEPAMDEFKYSSGKDYFRIATDSDGDCRITVFDADMEEAGLIKNLSEKGENIYSVVFDGEKAYAASYLPADPLYIIDLSNPVLPKIAGSANIPGNGYLCFLESKDGYIFTAGRRQDKHGNWLNGLKVSLFDADEKTPVLTAGFEVGIDYAYTDSSFGYKDMTHYVSGESEVFAFVSNQGREIYENDSYYWLPDYNLYYYTVTQTGDLEQKFLGYTAAAVAYDSPEEHDAYAGHYADRLRKGIVIGDYIYLIGSHTIQRYNAVTFEIDAYTQIWESGFLLYSGLCRS